jgi:hypothetical protein
LPSVLLRGILPFLRQEWYPPVLKLTPSVIYSRLSLNSWKFFTYISLIGFQIFPWYNLLKVSGVSLFQIKKTRSWRIEQWAFLISLMFSGDYPLPAMATSSPGLEDAWQSFSRSAWFLILRFSRSCCPWEFRSSIATCLALWPPRFSIIYWFSGGYQRIGPWLEDGTRSGSKWGCSGPFP